MTAHVSDSSVGSEDKLRTSYGKLSRDMPQYIMEFKPGLTLSKAVVEVQSIWRSFRKH